MKKELIRLMVIGCIGIISFIGVKEAKTSELYDVEIIHISQIEKAQEQQNKFGDKDMVIFLGWMFSLKKIRKRMVIMKKTMVGLLAGLVMTFGVTTGYCETTHVTPSNDVEVLIKMEFIKMSSDNYPPHDIFAQTTLRATCNHEGEVMMGDIVPLTDGTKENVGVDISVLPKIENGRIRIQTKSNVSYISEFDKAGNPIIQRNVTEADLICKNNQTVILGGLIGEKQENAVFVKITPEIQNP